MLTLPMRARALLATSLFLLAAASQAATAPLVVVARIDTPIHPAAANYLESVLTAAEEQGAALVVLTLSTPGGLLSSTREMSSAMLLSKVPIATYVSPSGAQAASAGFMLLLSGDVAAMAPGTNTGAAHPVGGEGQDLPKELNEKAEQDARAFVRTLAKQRGRNVDKAELAVSKSISYTEAEAKSEGLIEIVARDVPDLLAQLDGRRISRVGGGETTLATKGYRIETHEMGQMDRILGVVSHPNVAYLLFLLGLAGLYFELSTPGAVLPGIVGGISLLLALYAFSVLPVNLAGVALILFGILLFIAEIKIASHGLLSAGGALALIAGSLLLFSGKGDRGGYRVDLGIILPGLAVMLGIVGFLTWNTIQRRKAPVRTGLRAMIGQDARVIDGFGPAAMKGRVQIFGEYWDAAGPPGIAQGDTVRIRSVEGRTLHVERRNE